MTRPVIVGLGGTLRPGSSTEKALLIALRAVEAGGAETVMLNGDALDLPLYAPHQSVRTPKAVSLVEALRRADGVILGSPGYHGSLSGHVKNALDYVEDMNRDEVPYLQGRAVGCIATGAGWQGAVNTLTALRAVVHALRGWPTPLGVAINTAEPAFDADGECLDVRTGEALRTMAEEVLQFARKQRAKAPASPA